MQKFLRPAAWILACGLAAVTLSPIGLRPHFGPPSIERSLAYALFGLVAALAYPRQRLAVLVGVVILAGLLEYAQVFTASRHGRLADFAVKAGAALLGAGFALGVTRLAARRPA